MKPIYTIISLLSAALSEWLLAAAYIRWVPPLIFFMMILSLWDIKFWRRIWFVIFLGILFDSLSPFPYGTHLVVFLLLGLLIQGFRTLFSNVDSLLTRWTASSLALFLSLASLYPVGFGLSWMTDRAALWSNAAEIAIITYASWSLFLPLLWFGAAYTLKKLRARGEKPFMI